jgi:hypothetical protein
MRKNAKSEREIYLLQRQHARVIDAIFSCSSFRQIISRNDECFQTYQFYLKQERFSYCFPLLTPLLRPKRFA